MTVSTKVRCRSSSLVETSIARCFLLRLIRVISRIPSARSRSEMACEMYPLPPTSRSKSFRVKALRASGARSLVLGRVSMAWMISPAALMERCSLNPYTQPMVPRPCAARPAWCGASARLGWQYASGVESTMEIPVHRPLAQTCRKGSSLGSTCCRRFMKWL